MAIMVESVDSKDRPDLVKSLTGPFRTMGDKFNPDEANAPSWWHGDEEAYESSMGAMMALPQRGQARG